MRLAPVDTPSSWLGVEKFAALEQYRTHPAFTERERAAGQDLGRGPAAR